MQISMSSATLAATAIAGFLSIGLTAHRGTVTGLDLSAVYDGTSQTIYEDSFDAGNVLRDPAIDVMGALKFAVFGDAARGAIVGEDGWIFTSEELEETPAFDANIAMAAAKVARVARDLAAQGVEVLPVIVPDKAEIYEDFLGVRRTERIRMRRVTFLDQLRAEGVAALDAAPLLMSAKTEAQVFQKDDTHWSPAGSQVVARAVATRLALHALASATVVTQAAPDVPFDGDLLAFVRTGVFRQWVGPSQQMITPYSTKVVAEGGLFGDPQVDVVLVGTSFSAKPEWHFEGFLKQALQADLINFAQSGQGPFAPMEAFLASDLLNSTPPKVVIWEIPARYVSKEL